LLALGEKVLLTATDVLQEAHHPSTYVYFPVTAVLSLFLIVEGHGELQTRMVGSEGMLGVHVVLGKARPSVGAVVQYSGWAWRIETHVLAHHLQASTTLKSVLDQYALVLIDQLTLATACMRYHTIEQRLARWLLMCQDRVGSSQFGITQETLSELLGVRRVGVTNAASDFRTRRFIAYDRGQLQVLDRAGLEKAACRCYARDKKIYTDLLD
jgi:CRP-like cAMP-binding protein